MHVKVKCVFLELGMLMLLLWRGVHCARISIGVNAGNDGRDEKSWPL